MQRNVVATISSLVACTVVPADAYLCKLQKMLPETV